MGTEKNSTNFGKFQTERNTLIGCTSLMAFLLSHAGFFNGKKKVPVDFKNQNVKCTFEISRDKVSSMKKWLYISLKLRKINAISLFEFTPSFPFYMYSSLNLSKIFCEFSVFIGLFIWLVLSVCALNMSWTNFRNNHKEKNAYKK